MWCLILIPFFLQSIAILFDEMYFHWKRGLPKWERIGHPLDTLGQLICVGTLLFIPYHEYSIKIFIGLSVLSCLLITKDEFIHKEEAPWEENWLHAVLFILHPLALLTALTIYLRIHDPEVLPQAIVHFLNDTKTLQILLYGYFYSIMLFFIYQAVYWNFIWKPQEQK